MHHHMNAVPAISAAGLLHPCVDGVWGQKVVGVDRSFNLSCVAGSAMQIVPTRNGGLLVHHCSIISALCSGCLLEAYAGTCSKLRPAAGLCFKENVQRQRHHTPVSMYESTRQADPGNFPRFTCADRLSKLCIVRRGSKLYMFETVHSQKVRERPAGEVAPMASPEWSRGWASRH